MSAETEHPLSSENLAAPRGRWPADATAMGPAVAPEFQPRLPWIGGDLQTLRNAVIADLLKLAPADPGGRRLWLDVNDGSGDRLAASLTLPDAASATPRRPVVLIHGLTGCEDSTYILNSTNFLLERGYPVLRLNMRGAGPSRKDCRGIYHAGRSEDLAAALKALRAAEPELFGGGAYIVGYSLGGNVVLKFLAEYRGAFDVAGAVAISAPIDLLATSLRFLEPRNRIYHLWMINRLRRECLGGEITALQAEAIRGSATVYEIDDRFVGPVHGFAGAEDYYTRCSATRFLDAISAPTLVIHAQDDPWVPFEPYARTDWSRNPMLKPAFPNTGGHVGFHSADGSTWHDRAVGAFLDGLG